MVKQLEKEVADVELPAGRDCGVLGLKFFGKVDFERQGNLVVVCSLLIIAAAEAPNHPFKEFPALVQQGDVLGITDSKSVSLTPSINSNNEPIIPPSI